MSDFRGGGRSFGNRGPSSRGPPNRGGPRRFNDGPREMHKATCADCGNECDVPFKPTEGKPVYCRDCFQKHKKF
ncbi:DNA-directed RNA polymerase [Candidatus Woesearchaeota archaeon]|nr:DNA-directed RNA polymerase [Candidatus Woesearchaeota archaeon]MCF7901583.1 DNA-directed RNA polymerase [Candidatus Woesearchaeota archaeon]MCF8013652.1 DNA-directed RNA polymerase [Candidatus Woesearchaeota archaeon]